MYEQMPSYDPELYQALRAAVAKARQEATWWDRLRTRFGL
jgi:hypothetical protein